MSVRVVARIRPLLKSEREIDTIVEAACPQGSDTPSIVRIPNPKNAAESYSFNFNRVYDQAAGQQDLFDSEVSPTVKHLFAGYDVTIFAYGVTGTGKTHTMKGGKSLADRGVIPRLLSAMYRKQRKVEKDSGGEKKVELSFSYYEIYCDKVFDLLQPPETRTPSGLPIRDNNGKTVVAGLTETHCGSLKEFESLYDQANMNRSVGATKLNAQSSRSHAILSVKVTQRQGDKVMISNVSAIDLAGSEDNRRTENGKERLIESSAINKSLFVLAQCVEAISKKQSRIPYRESKMTRILSLGQNNGLTVMILNLAPMRAYHLDTISSLNFANRTKKIEVREAENEPMFKSMPGPPKESLGAAGIPAGTKRQPLRALNSAANIGIRSSLSLDKPAKGFAVFAEQKRISSERTSLKRVSDSHSNLPTARPSKIARTIDASRPALHRPNASGISRTDVEEMVNRLVEEKLAARALNEVEKSAPVPISEEVAKRLAALESRIEKQDDSRTEGLQYLLMAKQHQVRGEEASALRMYQLALPFFPDNENLAQKMLSLQESIRRKRERREAQVPDAAQSSSFAARPASSHRKDDDGDEYHDYGEFQDEDNDDFDVKPKRTRKKKASHVDIFRDASEHFDGSALSTGEVSPRTSHLLRIINTRDVGQIRSLKGVGEKKARQIVDALCGLDDDQTGALIMDLDQLYNMKGLSAASIDKMRMGLAV